MKEIEKDLLAYVFGGGPANGGGEYPVRAE
ncbi:hypothetical protein N481_00625 [Pseudoalteromonas luteoviolacea S4047-1]|uniref:Uncharacterized protein n=1 Tax=Pseudoalteromonas luteoviolacea S4054 TaxID=1129367 RepID=A0A0F6A887_9GAMM|nr:hypothetical protein N479_18995 [Pseudoalteromonas luteoviolacea S4054]KZN78980.1 hypothetical protein N481_00625 [Pseudoalteromonas luteoviolacea S4047-1]